MVNPAGGTLPRDIQNFINGAYCPSATHKRFESRNPADNALSALVHEASREDVERAVTAAKSALHGPWGQMSLNERASLLNRVADLIMERAGDLARAEVNDTGKLFGPTLKGEIPRGAQQFSVFAEITRTHFSFPDIPSDIPGGGRAVNHPARTPKGVIAAICPWNLPFILSTWKIAPALACGNTVVVKPSEETPVTATLLGEIMNEAGIPPGVYNVVNGFGPNSAGEFLVSHPDIDAITFTGETRTGAAIMARAAADIKDVSLELGGKNAGIIFADCDFDKAVAATAMSVFHNCGQVCLCTERLYIERPIFDKFVHALKEKAESLTPGDPRDPLTTLSPLISRDHREKVLKYFELARTDGATIVTGGGVPEMEGRLAEGAWIQPTIWTGLLESSRVIKEEVFGPVCHIAPFDEESEAVAMVNNSSYGLAATVWSGDIPRARRVAAQIEAGIIWVNAWMIRELKSPFGGFKKSGIGREGGEFSLDFYTEIKNVCILGE